MSDEPKPKFVFNTINMANIGINLFFVFCATLFLSSVIQYHYLDKANLEKPNHNLNLAVYYISAIGFILTIFVYILFIKSNTLKKIFSKAVENPNDKSGINEKSIIKNIINNKSFSDRLNDIIEEKISNNTIHPSIGSETRQNIETAIAVNIEKHFNEKIDADLRKKLSLKLVEESYEKSRARIADSIVVLAFRTNVNLFIGIVMTVISISLLGYFVSNTPSMQTMTEIVGHAVPRVTLVLFGELFAYFFLKMYKAGITDIKYYQNEITNIEFRYSALLCAMTVDDKAAVKSILLQFAKAERNFILQKGQTTVEIEKSKIDMHDTTEMLKVLKKAKKE